MPFFGHMNSWCVRQSETTLTHIHTHAQTYTSQRRKAALGKRFASFGGISRLSLADLSPTQPWPHTHTHTSICICHCCCCLWQLVAAVRTVHAITRRMQTPTMPPAASQRTSWSGNAEITDHNIYLFLWFAYKYFFHVIDNYKTFLCWSFLFQCKFAIRAE